MKNLTVHFENMTTNIILTLLIAVTENRSDK